MEKKKIIIGATAIVLGALIVGTGISKADLFKLEKLIENEIDKTIDSVIIFKSRNERWLEKDILGMEVQNKLFI